MKRLNIYKILLAVILTLSLSGIVFYQKLAVRSRADEAVMNGQGEHKEVYFEDDGGEPVADAASPSDAQIADVGTGDRIESGELVYYGGEPYTRYYTVYMNGQRYSAYCGDHGKNAVRSTGNVTFGTTQDTLIRKAFMYGPDSSNAWSGFSGMSRNDRQLVMALTLNYIRHGQYFPVVSEFYRYITSSECYDVILDSDQTELTIVEDGSGKKYGHSVILSNYARYRDASSDAVRKRTVTMRINGAAMNYVNMAVPGNTWLHIIRKGTSEIETVKSGSAKIMTGDRFFFSAELDYAGKASIGPVSGLSGVTAYTVDSNSTTADQQLLFGGRISSDSISISLDWKEIKDEGYMWLLKNKNYDKTIYHITDSEPYNGGRYGVDNYSYAGIMYLVKNSDGKCVSRFLLSYDGCCYVDKTTGKRIVLKNSREKKLYNGRIKHQRARLPYGEYTVEEANMLWECNNATGDVKWTDRRVISSGYRKNDKVYKVRITKDNGSESLASALLLHVTDEAVKGQFSMQKTDEETGDPVGGAVYRIVKEAVGGDGKEVCVAIARTDSGGNGIFVSSLYGGKGTAVLTGLPIGRYRIYEKSAPKKYELNSDEAILEVSPEGEKLYVNGRLCDSSDTYSVRWSTTDKEMSGSVDIKIYKQDAATYGDPQGDASLEGAEFTVRYYSGIYYSKDKLPKEPDRTWVLRTDEKGFCDLSSEYISKSVKSDDFYLDDRGKATIPQGTITVQETSAPVGYTLTDPVVRNGSDGRVVDVTDGVYLDRVTSDGDRVSLAYGEELIVGNHVVRGDFKLRKKDADTGAGIGGIKFLLENDDRSQSVVICTDDDGYYSSSSDYISHAYNTNGGNPGDGIWFGGEGIDDEKGALPYGRYHLTELRCDANRNKYKNIGEITFEIGEDGVNIDLGEIENNRFATMTSYASLSGDDEKRLSPGTEMAQLTDLVSMEGLEIGHVYTLHGWIVNKETGEKLLDEGTDTKVKFTADKEKMDVQVTFSFSAENVRGQDIVCFQELLDGAYEGEIIASHKDINSKAQTIYIGDNSVKICKVAATDRHELPGAELRLLDGSGKEVDHWVSDGTVHVVRNLSTGRYTLEELSAPAGYLLSRPITFDVDEHGEVRDRVEMVDSTAKVGLRKIDDVTGRALSGAEFEMRRCTDDEIVCKGTTDKNGELQFDCVEPGEYYLIETRVPDGYGTAGTENKKIKVVVEENMYENVPVITVKNHYERVYLQKQDSDDGKVLNGALFELIDEEGKTVAEAETGKDGLAVFEGIPGGRYSIREKKAPEGYELYSGLVSIDTDGQLYDKDSPVIINNKKKKEFVLEDRSPDTGDGSIAVTAGVVFCFAAILIAGLIFYRKKYSESKKDNNKLRR